MTKQFYLTGTLIFFTASIWAQLPKIGVQEGSFIDQNNDCFVPFGYNYGGTGYPLLLEDNWLTDSAWALISSDFQEMKALSANTVRIHLQYNRFMDDPLTPNQPAFNRLRQLAQLAEDHQLYLLITGLGAYRPQDQPVWYDTLNEQNRWATQAIFWAKVAETLHDIPSVFSYDLMNEPVFLDTTTWTPGHGLAGLFFVQNLTLTPNGRSFQQILSAWSQEMIAAIRAHDPATPISIGLIACGPIKQWSSALDYISIHAYPTSDTLSPSFCSARQSDLINLVANNQDNKPFVVTEIAPLYSFEATDTFMRVTCPMVNGWFNHYGGIPPEDIPTNDTLGLIAVLNLLTFKALYPLLHQCQSACQGATECQEASPPDPNLVANYTFNANSLDDSGSNLHLVNHEATYTSTLPDQPNTALDFEPDNMAYLLAPDSFEFQHDRSFSIVARFFPRWTSYASIWAYDDKDSHDGDSPATRDVVRLELNNTGLFDGQVGGDSVFYFVFSYGNDNSTFFSNTERLLSQCFAFDEWYTLTAVYDAGADSSYLYVNGHLQASLKHSIPISWACQGQYPLVGRNDAFGPWFPGYFNGKIDYIKVFNRALHPLEVAACSGTEQQVDCTLLVETTTPARQPEVQVYPNPARDRVLAKLNNYTSPLHISLIDANGRRIVPYTEWTSDGFLALYTATLPRGLYVLSLIDANGQRFSKQIYLH